MSSKMYMCEGQDCGATNPESFYINKSKKLCKECICLKAKEKRDKEKSQEEILKQEKEAEQLRKIEEDRHITLTEFSEMAANRYSELLDKMTVHTIEAIGKRDSKIEALENRIAELESRLDDVNKNTYIIVDGTKIDMNQIYQYIVLIHNKVFSDK